jgi:hypothetical protein
MSDMQVGFVGHVEARGGESLRQLLCDQVAGCHGVPHMGPVRLGQSRLAVIKVWSAQCIIVFVKA